MPSPTGKLLDALVRSSSKFKMDKRPWGIMTCLGAHDSDITIKHIFVEPRMRTSLQYHELKDELLIILDDFDGGVGAGGYVFTDDDDDVRTGIERVHTGIGRYVRIKPGTRHRVVGPLEYLEISTYDDDTDTIRVVHDFGRAGDL